MIEPLVSTCSGAASARSEFRHRPRLRSGSRLAALALPLLILGACTSKRSGREGLVETVKLSFANVSQKANITNKHLYVFCIKTTNLH